MKITFRTVCLLAFIVICLMLGFATYLQEHVHISPCPLCIFQRFTFMVLGVIFLAGVLLPSRRWLNLIISALAYVYALAGALLAGRQIWLQHLPPNQMSDCGASLEYMMRILPLQQVLQKVLAGSAECSLVDWRFLGMSLAEWSFLSFSAFLFLTAWLFFSSLRQRKVFI
jgi:disulfide bond formation protein DsbB